MPTNEQIEATVGAGAGAARHLDLLLSILRRHEAGVVCVQPSELSSVFLGSSCGAMFISMACGVIERKYARAGRPNVAACVAELRALAHAALGWAPAIAPLAGQQPGRPPESSIADRLQTRYRRLGNYRSRREFGGDPDLHLCAMRGRSFSGTHVTPWVFQQDDMRYRWTDKARHKLRYLADCWDAYSRCDYTPACENIGEADFPVSDRLRPEIPPCP